VLPAQSQHLVMTVTAEGTVRAQRVEVGESPTVGRSDSVGGGGLSTQRPGHLEGLLRDAPGTKGATQDGTIVTQR